MSKIAVIGSGFAGLASACCLAKDGHQVTVFEKNSAPGGRARQFKANGFTFDMGPSWYWMPDVFEKFFNQFGKSSSDFYKLERLDPSYRVFFGKNDTLDTPAKLEEFYKLFESLEPGSKKNLEKFLKEAAYKYEVGINDLVFKPGKSLKELIDLRLIKGVFQLHIFQSIDKYIRKYFKHPRIIQLLEFPVLFLGAMPSKTPALYSLMNYADIALGTWYPQGGMHKIVEAMVTIASDLGVTFKYNSPVQEIAINSTKAKGLIVNDKQHNFDFIIGGADYEHIEQNLLPKEYRRYTKAYWEKREMAPSSLIFYLGVDKKINHLLHHNLFFDESFEHHAKQIYEEPKWPDKPLFYVCAPSKTDDTVAPDGMENLFILLPVAPGLEDTEALRKQYYQLVMDRLEELTGESIKDHVVYQRSYAHNDFINDYNAFKGNAYGLANTLRQTANLKPAMHSKLDNVLFTGQLTVPGPGVPPSIISGQVVAKEINKKIHERTV